MADVAADAAEVATDFADSVIDDADSLVAVEQAESVRAVAATKPAVARTER
jgi:hypothetical protein